MQVDEDTGQEQKALEAEKDAKATPEDSSTTEEETGAEAAEGSEAEGDGAETPQPEIEEEKRLKRLAYLQRQERKYLRDIERRNRDLAEENRKLSEATRRNGADAADGNRAKAPPKRDDFPDEDAYFDARYEWRRSQERETERAEAERRRQTESQERERAAIQDAAAQVLELGEAEYGDEWEEISRNTLPPAVVDAIAVADGPDGKPIGHKVAAWLYENPEATRALWKMPAAKRMVAVGRIATAIGAHLEPPKVEKKVTNAKPPIKPVGGQGGGATKKVNPDDLPIDQWMKLEQEGKLKY